MNKSSMHLKKEVFGIIVFGYNAKENVDSRLRFSSLIYLS